MGFFSHFQCTMAREITDKTIIFRRYNSGHVTFSFSKTKNMFDTETSLRIKIEGEISSV